MTALTVNGSAVAATTPATTPAAAGKLFSAIGGTSGSTSTKVTTTAGRKQMFGAVALLVSFVSLFIGHIKIFLKKRT